MGEWPRNGFGERREEARVRNESHGEPAGRIGNMKMDRQTRPTDVQTGGSGGGDDG